MFGFSIAGIAAKFAESFLGQKVKGSVGFVREIPRPVWEALAVLGYALALYYTAHHALKQADQAGYDRRAAEDAKVIAGLRQRAVTAASNGKIIAQDTRSKNDAANLDIHGAAHAIGMRGPGAASCRQLDHPAVPAASGQPHAASDQLPDAARDPVPAGNGQSDLAAVPFEWLVGRAEQADLDRAEVIAWRDWYQRQAVEWAKLRDNGSQSPSK